MLDRGTFLRGPGIGAAIHSYRLPRSRWATFRTSLGSIRLLRCAASRFVSPLTALDDFFAGDRRRRGVSTGILCPACCRLDRMYVYLS